MWVRFPFAASIYTPNNMNQFMELFNILKRLIQIIAQFRNQTPLAIIRTRPAVDPQKCFLGVLGTQPLKAGGEALYEWADIHLFSVLLRSAKIVTYLGCVTQLMPMAVMIFIELPITIIILKMKKRGSLYYRFSYYWNAVRWLIY